MARGGTLTLTIADAPAVIALLRRAEAEITTLRALVLQANDALSCALSTPQCRAHDDRTGALLPWYTQALAAEAAIRRYLATHQPQQGGE